MTLAEGTHCLRQQILFPVCSTGHFLGKKMHNPQTVKKCLGGSTHRKSSMILCISDGDIYQ